MAKAFWQHEQVDRAPGAVRSGESWGSGAPCVDGKTDRKWREGPEGRDWMTYFLDLLCSLDAWMAGTSKGKGSQFGGGNAIEGNGSAGPTVGLSKLNENAKEPIVTTATDIHWELWAGQVQGCPPDTHDLLRASPQPGRGCHPIPDEEAKAQRG